MSQQATQELFAAEDTNVTETTTDTAASGTVDKTTQVETKETPIQKTDAGGQQEIAKFLEALPEDLRKEPTMARFKSVADLAKSFLETKKMVGAQKIKLPGNDATPEELNEFFSKLGRPSDPKEYQLPKPGKEAVYYPQEEFTDWFKTKAHDAGLSQVQTAKLFRAYVEKMHEDIGNAQTTYKEQFNTTEANLKKEWGVAYEQNVALARNAKAIYGEKLFGAGGVEKLDKLFNEVELADGTLLGNHPEIIKLFSLIGREVAEDDITDSGGVARFIPSLEQASQEIKKLQSDKDIMAAWRDQNHPRHNEVRSTFDRLYQIAHPEPVEAE